MFTGIIENLGRITNWVPDEKGGVFTIQPNQTYQDIKIGESIAINGCCLTVIKDENGILSFDVSDETIRKTAMIHYQNNQVVNLERAMLKTDRFGGHFVLGHVDCVGKVLSKVTQEGSVLFEVEYPKEFAHLLIEKGSVTVDGISLTVCELKMNQFGLYIIPHTLEETSLGQMKEGTLVNLEFDVLGKYMARQIEVQNSKT